MFAQTRSDIAFLCTDDKQVEHTIKDRLSRYYEVRSCSIKHLQDDTEKARVERISSYKLILLDCAAIGLALIPRISRNAQMVNIPLVAICRGGPQVEVNALLLGADIALSFPFNYNRLQAKCVAFQRRGVMLPILGVRTPRVDTDTPPRQEIENEYVAANEQTLTTLYQLRFDPEENEMYVGSEILDLTSIQFEVLKHLINHVGHYCCKSELLKKIWGYDCEINSSVVAAAIHRLRKSLKLVGLKNAITTQRGRGYRLEPSALEQGTE